MKNEKMYHIGIDKTQGAKYAILTGDPGRVESLANLLDNAEFVASNREYTTWQGFIENEKVLVTSHGIGGPSAAICVEELARCGVDTMIRVGTCGGMKLDVQGGDAVIANAAIRQEGTSLEYLPAIFPAVSDFDVTTALSKASEDLEATSHVGVVHCKDSFYGQHSPEESPVAHKLIEYWKTWLKAGCLASEMETAALFTVAQSKGIKAGCVLHVLWNQERKAAGLDDNENFDTMQAAKIAIRAIEIMMNK